MKLNLLINNPGGARSGYVNVDPIAPDGDADRIKGQLEDLNHVCDAAEVAEIVAHDILDFFPAPMADKVLDHWVSRLAHGGTLTVSVVDLLEVSRAFVARSLDTHQANELLHGKQGQPWEVRMATYHVPVLVDVLARKGLKIMMKRISNYRAVVVAQRP